MLTSAGFTTFTSHFCSPWEVCCQEVHREESMRSEVTSTTPIRCRLQYEETEASEHKLLTLPYFRMRFIPGGLLTADPPLTSIVIFSCLSATLTDLWPLMNLWTLCPGLGLILHSCHMVIVGTHMVNRTPEFFFLFAEFCYHLCAPVGAMTPETFHKQLISLSLKNFFDHYWVNF